MIENQKMESKNCDNIGKIYAIHTKMLYGHCIMFLRECGDDILFFDIEDGKFLYIPKRNFDKLTSIKKHTLDKNVCYIDYIETAPKEVLDVVLKNMPQNI